MSRYNDISIKKLVEWINNTYLLPDIQRPFVWWNSIIEFEEKVCSLFDSILRNYPIWTLLFWKVDKKRMDEDGLKPLKFLDNSNKDKNDEYSQISSEKDYILVLDGQQRMTIFNLVFNWIFEDTYRNKQRKRNLYFNLLKNSLESDDENDNLYEFKFFEENNWEYFKYEDKIWFKVKDIIKLKIDDLEDKFDTLYNLIENISNDNKKVIRKNLSKLLSSIQEENLSYYEIEKEKKDDEALEIFVRVNSKWMVLSYSDLLFSKITQFWKSDENSENARDTFYYFLKWDDTKWEIKWINRFWQWFNFSNDFILKASLVLIDSEIRYRLKNFNKENISLIKNNWNKITLSIRNVVEFLEKIWINSDKLLRSNNSIIPLIYYIFKNNLESKSIELSSSNYEPMKKYIYTILLNGVFWWQTDQLLTDSRKIINENLGWTFPLQEIIKQLGQKRNIKKWEEIKDLLDEIKYNTDKSKIILSILYGNEMDKDYQEDHLFPQTKTKKIKDKNLVDNICNIQILKNENQIKNDKNFKEYREEIIKKIPDYDEKNFIPKLEDYSIDYFDIFLEKRKELIYIKVKSYFNF